MSYHGLPPHLKEQFLREFSVIERMYFLKKAHEAIIIDGYVPGEDLYYYCYFLTQKKRIETMVMPDASGLFRYLVVEGSRDVDEAIKIYKTRLEKSKQPVSVEECNQFLRYLEGPS